MRAWLSLSAVCAAVVEDLLSEPPRRMKSEQQGPMSRDRPEAAAERSEDRVRTVAKPDALDSGPCELCVDQEVALKADAPRHAPAIPLRAPPRGSAAAAGRSTAVLCDAEARILELDWCCRAMRGLVSNTARAARHARRVHAAGDAGGMPIQAWIRPAIRASRA